MAKDKKPKAPKKSTKVTEKKVEEIVTKKEEVFVDEHSDEECPHCGDHNHDVLDAIIDDVSSTIYDTVQSILDKYEDDIEQIDIPDMVAYMLIAEAATLSKIYGMRFSEFMNNVGMASHPFLATDDDHEHNHDEEPTEEGPKPEVKKPNLKLVN